MNLLLKATEEKEDFYDLIYTEVTFASDLYSIGGAITHTKGEKAFISEVIYTPGFWSRMGSDYIKPRINTLKINGMPGICFTARTFEEFKNIQQ